MAGRGGELHRGVAVIVMGALAATALWVASAAHPEAAVAQLSSPNMYRYDTVTTPDFAGIYPYYPVSLSADGLSAGIAATPYESFAPTQPLTDPRTKWYAVADTAPDSVTRDLRLMDAPGTVAQHPVDKDLSADGLTFVATYEADPESLGSCSVDWNDASLGAQYWQTQVLRWQRLDRNSEFGDPELVTVADPTQCNGVPADDGPDMTGVGGDSSSQEPTVSDDGEVVAFESFAQNFGPGTVATNGVSALYVSEHDGVNGFEVSMVTPVGIDGDVRDPMISGDGNTIVFVSDATNLVFGVAPPTGGNLVYVATRASRTAAWSFEVVSQSTGGALASRNGDGVEQGAPSIDGAGERVAFTTIADNLDTSISMPDEGPVVAIRDLDAETTAVVTNRLPPSNGSLHGHHLGDRSDGAHISHDGKRIAISGLSNDPEAHDQVVAFKADAALSSDPDDRRDARLFSRHLRSGTVWATATPVIEGEGATETSPGAYVTALPLNDAPSNRFEPGWALYFISGGTLGADIGRGWHGDPVDTANGSFRQDETDLAAPSGAGPASITRTHTSVGEAGGVFGSGWTSAFDEQLELDEDGVATLAEQNGNRIIFTESGSGPWRTTDGSRLTLTDDGNGGWTVSDASGAVRSFDGDGRITGWSVPGQPAVEVQWGDFSPLSMTAGGGYSITFDPAPEGTIGQATTSDGRQVDFAYTIDEREATRLVTVSRPHAVGQAIGTYGMRTYTWDGPWVAGIVDQVDATRTKVVVENTFDAGGRVTRQVTDTGDELDFAYGQKPDPFGVLIDAAGFTTVTNDASGDVTVYEYNDLGEVVGITDATGNDVTRSWATDRPEAATSRSGVATDHVYDDAGRVIEVTETAGVTTRTIETVTYITADTSPAALTDDRVATRTDEAGVTTTFTYDGAAREPETVSVPCDPASTDPSTPCPGSGLATTSYTYFSGPLAGLVESVTDPDGVVTEYTYAADRSVATTTTYDDVTPLITEFETIRVGGPGLVGDEPGRGRGAHHRDAGRGGDHRGPRRRGPADRVPRPALRRHHAPGDHLRLHPRWRPGLDDGPRW